MPVISVGEKLELYSISTYPLELLIAEYLRETNISFYLSVMFICFLATLKKLLKKKETEIEREVVEVFKYTSDRRKKAGK